MMVSFNWLKQYVNLPDSITAKEIAHKLTMSTVEIDKVIRQGGELDNIVVGKIISIEEHPNADKLKICKTDVGNEVLSIVCGGSNLRENMLVAVANMGAKIKWHGEGDMIELKPTTIRGVESQGMICASTEIGLDQMFPPKSEKEILDLSVILNLSRGNHSGFQDLSGQMLSKQKDSDIHQNEKIIGKSLVEILKLNDTIFEVDNKSMTHRPDLWGHYGLAREVAALYNKKLADYNLPEIKAGKEKKIKVNIEDKKLCPRYMAVAISGIKVQPSPEWLQKMLTAVGLRPIDNIVDVTNYVMYDLGQPMHVFDAGKLTINKKQLTNIVVRRAKDGELFKALDEREHKLDSRDFVIANEDKVIALAGVMGGENSGISKDTKTIIFESANFEPVGVRRTAQRLDSRTDSSARFEKSLDPNNCESALRRAVDLVLKMCPEAKVVSNIADESDFSLKTGPIELNWQFIWRKIGMELDKKTVIKILSSLGFEVKEKSDVLSVKVPSWRATKDISIQEDLVEEISRIYGYDNIAPVLPVFPIIPPIVNEQRLLERKIAEILSAELGFNEVYNYSFVSLGQIQKMGDKLENYIELDNPLSKEKPYLRRNLLANLLENVAKNMEYFDQVKIFEIGKVFKAEATGLRAKTNSDELLPLQDTWVTAVCVDKKDNSPFWIARRAVETIFSRLNSNFIISSEIDKIQLWEHLSRSALILCFEKVVGIISEINPLVGQSFNIQNRIGFVSLNLSVLSELLVENRTDVKYQPLPIFPEVIRDLAVLVKKEIKHSEIVEAAFGTDSILKKIDLFDVYHGQNIGEGYKSMAYHIKFGHADRTLTTAEVDSALDKIVAGLKAKFAAEVR